MVATMKAQHPSNLTLRFSEKLTALAMMFDESLNKPARPDLGWGAGIAL